MPPAIIRYLHESTNAHLAGLGSERATKPFLSFRFVPSCFGAREDLHFGGFRAGALARPTPRRDVGVPSSRAFEAFGASLAIVRTSGAKEERVQQRLVHAVLRNAMQCRITHGARSLE